MVLAIGLDVNNVFTLLLNVVQSVLDNLPVAPENATGKLNV